MSLQGQPRGPAGSLFYIYKKVSLLGQPRGPAGSLFLKYKKVSLQGQPRGPAGSLFEKITKENFDPASPTTWPCRLTVGQPGLLKELMCEALLAAKLPHRSV